MLVGALIAGALLPGIARGDEYSDYVRFKDDILRGSTDSTVDTWLSQNLERGNHLKVVQGFNRARATLCLAQLRLVLIDNRDIKTDKPPGFWVQEASSLIRKIDNPENKECNREIFGGEARLQAISARIDEVQARARREELQALQKECNEANTTYRKYLLDPLSCSMTNPDELAKEMAGKAEAARRRLSDLWSRNGRSFEAAQQGDLSSMEPGKALRELARLFESQKDARDTLWQEKSDTLNQELRALPAPERAKVSAPSKPADVGSWDYWTALESFSAEIAKARDLGGNYQERLANLRKELDGLPDHARECEGLKSLCAKTWAAGACRGNAVTALTRSCQATGPGSSATAGPDVLQRAIDARRALQREEGWTSAARSLGDALQQRARTAQTSCETESERLRAMEAAVGDLASARISQSEPFNRAWDAIQECQLGAAAKYTKLASAIEDAEGSVREDDRASLERHRRDLNAISSRVESNPGAENPGRLDEARRDLVAAMRRAQEDWEASFGEASEIQRRRAVIAGKVAGWLSAVRAARYADLEQSLERAVPETVGQTFACDWNSADLAGRPGEVVASWAQCKPASVDSSDALCGLLPVAALAAVASDIERSEWDRAESKLSEVEAYCENRYPDEKTRNAVRYFSGYIRWNKSNRSVAGLSASQSLTPLGFDPVYDKAIQENGVSQ